MQDRPKERQSPRVGQHGVNRTPRDGRDTERPAKAVPMPRSLGVILAKENDRSKLVKRGQGQTQFSRT